VGRKGQRAKGKRLRRKDGNTVDSGQEKQKKDEIATAYYASQ